VERQIHHYPALRGPVAVVDHEEILCYGRICIVAEKFPSLESFVMKVLAE